MAKRRYKLRRFSFRTPRSMHGTGRPLWMVLLRADGVNLLLNITVRHLGREAAFRKRFLDLLAEHHGAVFAAGAANGDSQIAFAFADVVRDQIGQGGFLDAAEKLPLCGNERIVTFAHFGIFFQVKGVTQTGHQRSAGWAESACRARCRRPWARHT